VLDRESPYSLYDPSIGSFAMGADYDQKDAAGFINILGLPIRLQSALREKQSTKKKARQGRQ
jgi:argininosuccinate synthase